MLHDADRHVAVFESKKKVNAIVTPDAQIVFVRAPYLQYEQILLTKNFRQYLQTIMLSSKFLRMGIQKSPYQKTYKLQAGYQEFTVGFKGCDRQFDWIEISLHYDENERIYDSYNTEYITRMIKKIEVLNISDAYSGTNMMKFDILNDTQKHLLWEQYVAWHFIGYTAAPISDHMNNPVFQSSYWSRTILLLNLMKKSILICGTVSDIQTRSKNRV